MKTEHGVGRKTVAAEALVRSCISPVGGDLGIRGCAVCRTSSGPATWRSPQVPPCAL